MIDRVRKEKSEKREELGLVDEFSGTKRGNFFEIGTRRRDF